MQTVALMGPPYSLPRQRTPLISFTERGGGDGQEAGSG